MSDGLTTVSGMGYEEAGVPIEWLRAQPYPEWAAQRAECPVARVEGSEWDPRGHFDVLAYTEAEAVLRDAETFRSSINLDVIGQFMGELIVGLDGLEHRKYRNLVAKAFRQSQLDRWDDVLVRPIISRLLDAVAPLGRAELVDAVTSRYPVEVICGIVGVPLEDAQQFQRWAEEINTGPLAPERGYAAKDAMTSYLRALVEERRANPSGDFLSDLVHSEIDGEQLSEERLYGFLRLLLPAGAETTFRVMGNCLGALLRHPDVLREVVADRSLVPEAIEETLRWETSVTMVSRVAATDADVAGCPIPAGTPVNVITGAANRDPARWDDAEVWKLGRPTQHHLAFGTGPHQCLGMHLARLELTVGLNAIFDRLPNLRLDPDAEPPIIEGTAFRGPRTLPVLFDPTPVT